MTTSDALRLFGALASLPVIWVLVVHGQVFTGLGWRRASVALQLPLAWVFMAMPISGVAMAPFSLEVVLDDIRHLHRGTTPARLPEDD